MRWVRAKDELPENAEEVLLRCRGIFCLAVFHAREKVFVANDGAHYQTTDDVHWGRLAEAEHSGKASR